MKKGTKQMAILLAAAVCLGGVYAGLNAYNAAQKAKELKAEEEKKVYISQMGDIQNLSITNSNGQFTFSYDKEKEAWTSTIAETFPLKQSKVTGITGKLENLQAVRALTDADTDLSVYGLAEPACTLTVQGEKDQLTILVGDQSAASSDYYVKTDGSDTIYTAASSFVSALNFTEDDLVNAETFPKLSSGNIVKVSWKTGDQELIWHKESRIAEQETETQSAEDLSEAETVSETDDASASEAETETEATTAEPVTEEYWMADDTEPENTDNLKDAVTLLGSLSFNGFADWYLEEDEQKNYGLNEEAGPITVTITCLSDGEETTTVLTIGSSTEDGTGYYCCLNDGTMVNLLKAEDVITLTKGLSQISAEEEPQTESASENETVTQDLQEETKEEETDSE